MLFKYILEIFAIQRVIQLVVLAAFQSSEFHYIMITRNFKDISPFHIKDVFIVLVGLHESISVIISLPVYNLTCQEHRYWITCFCIIDITLKLLHQITHVSMNILILLEHTNVNLKDKMHAIERL